jgi:hypothetical protein
MSGKYVRHQSVVSRQSDENIGEDHWLKKFQKSLLKGAVQPRGVDSSLFDQINSIMNGKSKYTSVDHAVQDMQERSGLTAYLDKINKSSGEESKTSTTTKTSGTPYNTKTALDNHNAIDKEVEGKITPIVFKKCPQVKTTLENYIRDTKGNLPLMAIIEKIKSIHQGDVSDAKDWDDDNLIREVSRQNLIAKRDNPASYENYAHLGSRDSDADSEIDPSNTDAFHALNPVKE